MEVDSAFLDPIKEFHPILRVVEMSHDELAAVLPLRINQFSFVQHPFKESYGFPIDAPDITGEALVKLHTSLTRNITAFGADTATVKCSRLLSEKKVIYNTFAPLGFSADNQKYCLRSDKDNDPIVIFEDNIFPLRAVEDHINALAIYCNTLHHSPADCESPLLTRMPDSYEIDQSGYLIAHGEMKRGKNIGIHGRYSFYDARDKLLTYIVHFMRI